MSYDIVHQQPLTKLIKFGKKCTVLFRVIYSQMVVAKSEKLEEEGKKGEKNCVPTEIRTAELWLTSRMR